MSDSWVMVKVGGSLYDLPDLRQRLHAFLSGLDAGPVLLIPGGGMTADVIRALDRVHHLGEEASHWLALRALSMNAHFLRELLPAARLVAEIPEPATPGWHILDAYPFFRADERRAEPLPHGWHVTSDSLALRAAEVAGARELILLKSTDRQQSDGEPLVDDYFAQALCRTPNGLQVRIVNLRADSVSRTATTGR